MCSFDACPHLEHRSHPCQCNRFVRRVSAFILIFLWPFLSPAQAAAPAVQNAAVPVLGINLSRVCYWSTAFPFKDLMKQSQPWQAQAEGAGYGKGPPLMTDSDGNIQWFLSGQFADTVVSRTHDARMPGGEHLCLYEGKGRMAFENDARLIRKTPGRLTVQITPTSRGVTLTLNKTDLQEPITNIRFFSSRWENTLTDQPFAPRFLEVLSPFKVIRFMDWMDTNNTSITSWDQRTTPEMQTQSTGKGVALEHMLQLANTLHVHPWFCMPHKADDRYVASFAHMVRERLDPGLNIYIEYTNEAWNLLFDQARYCRDRGQDLNLDPDPFQAGLKYYTRRSLEIFRIWENTFNGRDRLVRVLSAQFANPWTSSVILGYDNAGRKADLLAVAPYFGKQLGDPKRMAATTAMPLERLFSICEKEIDKSRTLTAAHRQHARQYGLPLAAYEGGQHLAGFGGAENNKVLTFLFHQMNRDPRMEALYTRMLNAWTDSGGGPFIAFAAIGPYTKWGCWGLLEHLNQDPSTAPKYRALRRFFKAGTSR